MNQLNKSSQKFCIHIPMEEDFSRIYLIYCLANQKRQGMTRITKVSKRKIKQLVYQ